jgi:hypothetical protein
MGRYLEMIAAVKALQKPTEGREVLALTEETAAIRWPGGSITTYRKNNKAAYGPLGDSLDDLR